MIKKYIQRSDDDLREHYRKCIEAESGVDAIGRDNSGKRIEYNSVHNAERFRQGIKILTDIILKRAASK